MRMFGKIQLSKFYIKSLYEPSLRMDSKEGFIIFVLIYFWDEICCVTFSYSGKILVQNTNIIFRNIY